MASRPTLNEELAGVDLETAQQICKKKKRSLNLDKLIAAANASKDPEVKEWLARRAMEAPPAKKNPRWTRPYAVAISGSMEDLEATLEQGDDWFAGSGALRNAALAGHDDVVTRVLEVMPDTDRARNIASEVFVWAIHSARRPLLQALVAVAPLTPQITYAAALRDEPELFERGLEAGEVDCRVVGALVTCERRYVDAVAARPDLLARGAAEGGDAWYHVASSCTGRWSPPRPEHTGEVAFLVSNLEALIRAGLTPDAAAVHKVIMTLDPDERPGQLELTLAFVEVMVRDGGVDLNVPVLVGEEWSAASEDYVEVSQTPLEDALVRMPLALCQALHDLGATLDGGTRVAESWNQREEKRAWLESLGLARASTALEVLGDALAPEVDYAALAALLLADPEGVAGLKIGMHEDEASALGFTVRDEWVCMETNAEGFDGAQTFEVGFTGGFVDQVNYELTAANPERMTQARDVFAAALTAAHGKARGTKNMTWRHGRTKCVLNAKSVTYGWDTRYRMRIELSPI